MSVFLRTGSREDLEREILRAVKQRGYCYAKDQLIADQIQATTEEQVMAWKQSFSERAGLTGRPYQEEVGAGAIQGGVIFQTVAETRIADLEEAGRWADDGAPEPAGEEGVETEAQCAHQRPAWAGSPTEAGLEGEKDVS